MDLNQKIACLTVFVAVIFALWQDVKGVKGMSFAAFTIFLCWGGSVTEAEIEQSIFVTGIACCVVMPLVYKFNLRKDYAWLFLALNLWASHLDIILFWTGTCLFAGMLMLIWVARWRALVAIHLPENQSGEKYLAPVQTALSVTPYGVAMSAGALLSMMEAL